MPDHLRNPFNFRMNNNEEEILVFLTKMRKYSRGFSLKANLIIYASETKKKINKIQQATR